MDTRVGKIHWRRDRLPTPVLLGFPGGSAGKESACNAGDLGSIPGLGRSPGEGKGYLLQYSDLENSTDYSPRGCKELDTTEQFSLTQSQASVGMVLDTAWVFIFQGHGLVYIFKGYRDNASFLLGILECNCLLSEV